MPLRRLKRLGALLQSEGGDLRYTLTFDRDAERRARVRGRVTAELVLECQRCLGPMALEVESGFQLGLVEGLEASARLPEALDPLLVEEARIDPATLLEDELLLSLPQIARHEEPCTEGPEAADVTSRTERTHPFAALAALKGDDTKEQHSSGE